MDNHPPPLALEREKALEMEVEMVSGMGMVLEMEMVLEMALEMVRAVALEMVRAVAVDSWHKSPQKANCRRPSYHHTSIQQDNSYRTPFHQQDIHRMTRNQPPHQRTRQPSPLTCTSRLHHLDRNQKHPRAAVCSPVHSQSVHRPR